MTTTKAFFSQTDNISKIIADEILAAKKYVLLAMYTLSDIQMIDALKKAKANEIEILLIFDQRQMHNNQSIFFTLNNAGLTFRTLEVENASMHHKFIVIDDITTITGSFNWTHSAQKKNYENIVVIKDSVVTEQYKNEFDRIWQRITSTPIDNILKQKELLEAKLQEERERKEKEKKEREARANFGNEEYRKKWF